MCSSDLDTHTVTAIDTTGTLGSVTNNTNGTFDYNPNGQFETLAVGETATDSFVYTIDDGNGGTDTGTVTITITGVNDAPVAVDDSIATNALFTTNEDTSYTTPNALANDTDIDASDTHTVTAIDTTGTLGSVTNNTNGTFD